MQELPISYDPAVLAGRVAGARKTLRWATAGTAVSVFALVAVIVYIQVALDGTPDLTWEMVRWVLAFSAGFGVLGLVARLVWLTRLRGGLRQVGEGPAVVLSAQGLRSAEGWTPWDEVEVIRAARGKLGHGYRLEVLRADGSTLSLPLEGLDILPGSLDAATRAYSAGRHGVDLSVVDD